MDYAFFRELSPSEESWLVIVETLDKAGSKRELLKLLALLEPLLQNWPDELLVAPPDWILSGTQQDEPKLSLCKCFEADLFSEVSYKKQLAEKILSLPVFLEQPSLAQLNVLFVLFGSISEYNSVHVTVRHLVSTRSIEDELLRLLDEQCPGTESPKIQRLHTENKSDVTDIFVRFLGSWYQWLDGFPKDDYLHFLDAWFLPTLQYVQSLADVSCVVCGSKWEKSYQNHECLVLCDEDTHLLLHMVCDLY